jgi:hypothetical protein
VINEKHQQKEKSDLKSTNLIQKHSIVSQKHKDFPEENINP